VRISSSKGKGTKLEVAVPAGQRAPEGLLGAAIPIRPEMMSLSRGTTADGGGQPN
jgi:hypothetical protein